MRRGGAAGHTWGMTDPTLDGPRRDPFAGGRPGRLVVLLHGLGADGEDLIQVADEIRHLLPDAAFLAPNAPEPCDMAPWGRQWFSLRSWTLESMAAGARSAAPALDAFLDAALAEAGLGPDRLALVGFSQGAMMALHVALRRPAPLAGVLGYSGALLGGPALRGEIRSRPPVMLVHGALDQVVPFAAMGLAEAELRAAGVPVEAVERPGLGHSIDHEGIAAGVAFLRRSLGAGAEEGAGAASG